MTSAVNVLLVETDELERHDRVEQLSMDGHAVDAVGDVDDARGRLAERPDALILGDEPQTIGLLRELRAGEIPRADSRIPVLVVGADDDSAAVRYYRAGADVALPSESSSLLVAAGLETLMRRAGPPGHSDCASREPDRRPGRPHRPRRRSAGEADPDRVRSAGDARDRPAPDVPPRRVDPRGVGLRARRRRGRHAPSTPTRIGCGASSSRLAPSRWCRTFAASDGGSPDERHSSVSGR